MTHRERVYFWGTETRSYLVTKAAQPASVSVRTVHCTSIQNEWPALSCDGILIPWYKWPLPGRQYPQTLCAMGHWMIWWEWKWCESYATASTVTRFQSSWTPMGDCGLMSLTPPSSKHQTRKFWFSLFCVFIFLLCYLCVWKSLCIFGGVQTEKEE